MRFNLLLLLFFVILAGCVNNSGKNNLKGVAATVNGVEITEREVDYIFKQRSTSTMSATESFNLKKAILSDLVNTQLWAQKARALKLHNSPDFTLATYNAQNSVLAMMAQKKISESIKQSDVDLLNDIIRNNPKLFSQRRLYVYDEIFIDSTDKNLLEEIDKNISAKNSITQISDIIRQKKLTSSYALKTVTSDNIPDEILSALDRLTPGVPQIIRVINRFSFVLVLHGSYPYPLSGEQALEKAEYLVKTRQTESVLSTEMGSLINNSDIKYFGDYSKQSLDNNLPHPDKDIAKRQQNKKFILLASLSLVVVSAVLSLTAAMRFIKGVLWLPRLWPQKKLEQSTESVYEIPFELHVVHKLMLSLIALIFLTGLGIAVFSLTSKISLLYIMSSILTGILTGVMMSRIYSLKYLQEWTDKVFLIVAALFVLPVFANLLLILRFSDL